ncbi:acyltransferase ChoActase/COT/CPT [Paraphysoderma sedebokerense]|nr:acyltransferase ChoActase/COT/CPT [Paraphysoderma sedebokerense]
MATNPAGKLYKHQETLPKLPVPTLQETCDKYLKTVRPLLSDTDFENTKKAVVEFQKPGGQGEELQKRLLSRAASSKLGWLAEWWNDLAYFGYRDPVVINVSYFFQHRDDKQRPTQTSRAASIVQAAMDFRKQVVTEELEPEMVKDKALCSVQYKYMFNSCRIPKKPSDTVLTFDPATHNHVAVVRKNQFYTFDLFHKDGRPLSTPEIEYQLNRVIEEVGDNKEPAVGALTSDNRDKWTETRELLVAADPRNEESLKKIESSVLLLCLDDSRPVTLEEKSKVCWHGDGRNRFYDKTLQFIVCENGKSGFLGEHSMMDGTPTCRLNDWILDNLAKGKINHGSSTIASNLPRPQKLRFTFNQAILDAIRSSEKSFDALVDKHELFVLSYDGYGKNLLKKFGVSPDAYVQMVMQLAYYKMYGVCRPTYESAQTRKFAYGRTETCRTVSVDSVAWVKAMENADVPAEEKAALCRKAIDSHVKYMSQAVDGRGVDRHLLGLRLLLRPDEPKPSIYKDFAYGMSCHWNLSTSQLTSEYFDGYGWGEVVEDGYGLAYMIKNNSIHINVTSMKLGAERLRFYLTESLKEMREMFEKTTAPDAGSPGQRRAKL